LAGERYAGASGLASGLPVSRRAAQLLGLTIEQKNDLFFYTHNQDVPAVIDKIVAANSEEA
jgi:hypothetical protein